MGQHQTFFVTCAGGTEGALRAELRDRGVRRLKGAQGGVRFYGPVEDAVLACLWSRVGQRVLLELVEGPAPDADTLYETAMTVPWEEYLGPDDTFAIRATGGNDALRHTRFTALKVKDAVADRIREKAGARPDVDPKRPSVAIHVHIDVDRASISLDMAGDALYRRGWRRGTGGEAPLRESLAAGVLAIGQWDPEAPLVDPLCGSGTLVIEAARQARGLPPALDRHYAFERWPRGGEALRKALALAREAARDEALDRAPAAILASDRDEEVVALARQNAKAAGVARDIEFQVSDVRELTDLPRGGQVVTNPPYGERLGQNYKQLDGFYRQLGAFWREQDRLASFVAIAPKGRFRQVFGGKPQIIHRVFNGGIPCEVVRWVRGRR